MYHIFNSFFANSCSLPQKKSEVEINVFSINLSLLEYTIYNDSETFKWYYPNELFFCFTVENKTKDSIVFGAFERRNYEKKWGRFRIKYKNQESVLFVNNQLSTLCPDDSTKLFVEALNTDLFFFDKIYSQKTFKTEFLEFIHKSEFEYIPVYKDYQIELGEKFRLYQYCRNISKFTIKDDVIIKVIIPNKPNIKLTLDNIGFPFEKIPDDVKVHKPLDDFPY